MRLFSIEDKDMQFENFHKGVFRPKWASAAHPSSQDSATITEERGTERLLKLEVREYCCEAVFSWDDKEVAFIT